MAVTAKKFSQTSVIGKSSVISPYINAGYTAEPRVQNLATVTLSSSKIVELYSDGTNLVAKVGNISSGVITFAEAYIVTSSYHASYGVSVAEISATQFVIAYTDYSTIYGKTVVATVSANVITFGSTYVYSTTQVYRSCVRAFSATSILIIFSKGIGVYSYNTPTRIIAGTISGSTITYGEEKGLASELAPSPAQSYAGMFDAAILDSTTALAYVTGTNSGNGSVGTRVMRIKVNGTVLSSDSWVDTAPTSRIYSAGTYQDGAVTSCVLSSTKMIVRDTLMNGSKFYVGTIDGGSITYGAPVADGGYLTNQGALVTLSSTTFLYLYTTGANYPACRVCTVSGNSITFGTEYIITSSYTITPGRSASLSVSALSATSALIGFISSGTYVCFCIATITGTAVSYGTLSSTLSNPFGSGAGSINVAHLSAAQGIAAMQPYVNGNASGAVVLAISISGTTITPGGITQVIANQSGNSTGRGCLAPLTSTTALFVGAGYPAGSYQRYAMVLSASGTTITPGSTIVVANTSAQNGSEYVEVMSPTNAVWICCGGSTMSPLQMLPLSISGTTVSLLAPVNANSWNVTGSYMFSGYSQADYLQPLVKKLDSTTFVVIHGENYQTNNNLSRPVAKVFKMRAANDLYNQWIGSQNQQNVVDLGYFDASNVIAVGGASLKTAYLIKLTSGYADVISSIYLTADSNANYFQPTVCNIDATHCVVSFGIRMLVGSTSTSYNYYTYGLCLTLSGTTLIPSGKTVVEILALQTSSGYTIGDNIVTKLDSSNVVFSCINPLNNIGLAQIVATTGTTLSTGLTATTLATGATGGHSEVSSIYLANMSADDADVVLTIGGSADSNVIRIDTVAASNDVPIILGSNPIILEAGVTLKAYTKVTNTGLIITTFGIDEV